MRKEEELRRMRSRLQDLRAETKAAERVRDEKRAAAVRDRRASAACGGEEAHSHLSVRLESMQQKFDARSKGGRTCWGRRSRSRGKGRRARPRGCSARGRRRSSTR